jgi:two-component sensor histidine kinase
MWDEKLKNTAKLFDEGKATFETVYVSKDGQKIPVEISAYVITLNGRKISISTIHDLTRRKKAEDEIKASLAEKDVLMREIHHRVKNNMQIVSSLLNLQTSYVEEEEAVNVLKESQNRVKSMAMIHEKLYQSHDLNHLNISNYIISLVTDLFSSYAIPQGQIKPIMDVEDANLNMETAVPCGLIISELISNSLKYAFPNGKKGEIHVTLKTKENRFHLTISDNGVGLPDDLDFQNTESLGLQLVNSLTNQLDGKIEVNRKHGTEFKITFKEAKYKERN